MDYWNGLLGVMKLSVSLSLGLMMVYTAYLRLAKAARLQESERVPITVGFLLSWVVGPAWFAWLRGFL